MADRFDRKQIMVATHLSRMAIVCLFPFVSQPWQIYAIVLTLNVFAAFFTPTYTATIPLVTTQREYATAIALSSATYQLLGVLGPGLAGSVAAFVGTRQIFWLDGLTFAISALLVLILPGQLQVSPSDPDAKTLPGILRDIRTGTVCLLSDPPIRYALLMQLVAAISGAAILVNTVSYVQGSLQLGKLEYGWVMATFGIGATLASFWLGNTEQTLKSTTLTRIGAGLIAIVLLPANWADLDSLLLLWTIAGIGQTLVNVPTQTLIAERVDVSLQGRVYGAHFAWSHLWWVFAYPAAGAFSSQTTYLFLGSSLLAIAVYGTAHLLLSSSTSLDGSQGIWHEHQHTHDAQHRHQHAEQVEEIHSHPHFHSERSSAASYQ